MKVALLGGSFNPPHVGHLLAAHYVRATQGVDEVWLMPAYQHPFGKALESFEHRVRMCEAMCRDTSGWLKASPVEREVSEQGGTGYTVETLTYLVEKHPRIAFSLILGSDILKDLPNWKELRSDQADGAGAGALPGGLPGAGHDRASAGGGVLHADPRAAGARPGARRSWCPAWCSTTRTRRASTASEAVPQAFPRIKL